MKTKKILVVVGTRPNFIKVTQFKKVAANYKNIDLKIVHTGQHFDGKMANIFFEQFNLVPDFFLNISTNVSANTQIAEILIGLEKLIRNEFNPDLMVCVGDVNSTLAAALVANKTGIKLAHVESGLRSYDSTMPEEHNRIITDKLTDLFFITEQSGWDNLINEGVDQAKMHFVGNTMIDTMIAFEKEIESSNVLSELSLEKQQYVLTTIHRPATVDSKEGLTELFKLLSEISKKFRIVFPIHPRTLKNIDRFGLRSDFDLIKNIVFTEPLDYFAFQKLIKYSKFILTDSGGIQEESTFLKVPCLTLRPNTERPVTCSVGSNTLLNFDLNLIMKYIAQIIDGTYKKGEVPYLWDGKATERIMKVLSESNDR